MCPLTVNRHFSFRFNKSKEWKMQGNQVIRFSSCVLLLLLLSGPFAEASVSLGFKSAWSGIQRALKSEKNPYRSPHITIHYPSGAVKDYIWTTVRPFLWSYVCRYCTYVPERCDGDLAYCKINLRKVRDRLTLYYCSYKLISSTFADSFHRNDLDSKDSTDLQLI